MAIDFKAQMAAKRVAANPTPVPTAAPTPIPTPAPTASPSPVPMSFTEKMALKKQVEGKAQATDVQVKETESPNVVAPPSPTIKPEESSGAVLPITVVSASTVAQGDTGVANPEASPEQQQAYADISSKIELLESLQDTALEGAMKELKRALMANPNAVALMHDTDYGKMVVALRKLTREAQVEAVAEKKSGGTKKKQTPLSAEDMAAVWDEI